MCKSLLGKRGKSTSRTGREMAQSKSEEKTAAFNQDSGKPGGYARKPVTMKDYLMLMQPYIPSGLSLNLYGVPIL